jgi:DnaJ domain
MRDPYESLAVSRSATADDIKKSFRRLAKELHPDANKEDAEAAARFAELNSAHEILGDEVKRIAFDRGDIDADGKPSRQVILRARSRRSRSNIAAGLMIVLLMLAVASTLVIRRLTPEGEVNSISRSWDRVLSAVGFNEEHVGAVQSEGAHPAAQSDLRLILQQNDSYAAGDTIPLGLQVSGEAAGLAVEISGLPTGTTVSSGRPLGAGSWRILGADVGNAMIHPPPGFGGVLEFAAVLRLSDDTVVDQGSFRLDWIPTVAPVPIASANDRVISDTPTNKAITSSAPTEKNARNRSAASPPDREQIELWIGRSQKLMSEGDVDAARTLLRHAAEAKDARAALALGSTYDPIMLAILQVRGVAADLSLAHDWYKKASELGSQEAQERLKLLASAKVDDGGPVALGRVEVSRNVNQESAAKDKGAEPISAKPNNRDTRSPTREQASPPDQVGVYVTGNRVGADPDPNIRAQLLRDDAGREGDTAGHQLLANPARPVPAVQSTQQ